MTSKPFLYQQPRRGHSVIVVNLRELGEMVDYDQDAGIVIVRGTDFQVVVLDQFVKISTLDVFQLESYITRLIAYLLTGEALANIAANTASDVRPRVTFLNPSHHFRNALVSQTRFRAGTIEA